MSKNYTSFSLSDVEQRIQVLQSVIDSTAEDIKLKSLSLEGFKLELTALKYYRDSLKLEESD